MDTKRRSWAKAITWKVTGIFLLAIVSYLFTGSIKGMTLITGIYHLVMIVLYYLHERVWDKISWGKIKHPLADIPIKGKLTPDDQKIIEEKLKELGYIE